MEKSDVFINLLKIWEKAFQDEELNKIINKSNIKYLKRKMELLKDENNWDSLYKRV